MLEKGILLTIVIILLSVVITSAPKIKAEKQPEVVQPASRIKLVESSHLNNGETKFFIINLDNKEYLVGSGWYGIAIVEVTK